MKKLSLLSFCLPLLLGSCGQDSTINKTTAVNLFAKEVKLSASDAAGFPYHLDEPDVVFSLSSKLTEISGLSISPDGKSLVAVNDEQGKLFFLAKNSGEVQRTITFGKAGDYEGLESVGNAVYVVKSNGDINRITDLKKKKPTKDTYKTQLETENDVEGLAYDPVNNRLLLACKGRPMLDKSNPEKRAIYAFDLSQHELNPEPVLYIDRRLLKGDFDKKTNYSKKAKTLSDDEKSADFGPSGIAIHPKNKDIYIISSVGKLMVVLNRKGQLKYFEKLDKSIFKQPEGICFDQDGIMYISSEGRSGKGKLMQVMRFRSIQTLPTQ